jgi:diguanylate cyclase (GGDEF)-like protein
MQISNGKKNLLFLILLGLVGALIDLLRIPFFYGSELILGPFVALMVASYQGVRAALFVSLISTVPIAIAWGSPWASFIFGLEAVFVALFYNRVWKNLLVSVFIFWVFIGIPLKWIYMKQYSIVIDSHILTFALKHLLNSIVYAHLAVLVTANERVARILHSNKYFKPLSLKKKLAHQLSIIFVTAGLVFGLFNLYKQTEDIYQDEVTQKDLLHSQINGELNSVIISRVSGINELVHTFSYVWSDDIKRSELLEKAYSRMSDYATMILANDKAEIINFHSETSKLKLDPLNPLLISDREYFKEAIDSKKPYVSSGFQGRGLGKDLIAVISSGIPHQNEDRNIGIIQGSMILGEFEKLKNLFNYSSTYRGILVDQNNRVLFSSKSLGIDELSELELEVKINDSNKQKVSQLKINSEIREDELYYFRESSFAWGWKLITLQNDTILASKIEKLLLVYSVVLLLMALLSEAGAAIISSFWTRQLTNLTTEIDDFGLENNSVSNHKNLNDLPEELAVLYEAIEKSKKHVNTVNSNLKGMIDSKTKELQIANTQLKIIAYQDYLTQLKNRRFFNKCLHEIWMLRKENKQLLSLMIIDIDYFKKVNDNWGHPTGDEVLKQVADYLKSLKNDSLYCLSRIGGEEFGIICLEPSHTDSVKLAESIQIGISNKKILIKENYLDSEISITVSIGVASINASNDTHTNLYKFADKALYNAKEAGRNCVRSINKYN